MNMEETKAAAKRLLKVFYGIDSEELPEQRSMSKWTAANKLGFLLGIVQYGQDVLVRELHSEVASDAFKAQEKAIIVRMFDFHILPFKQHTGNSCHTPSNASSSLSSRSNSENDLANGTTGKALSHWQFKKAVSARDRFCLFCWEKGASEGTHIITQKDLPIYMDEGTLLQRAGLGQKHQEQNGLLLCRNCHGYFDTLKRYVDVIDDVLVLKVVNDTNDLHNLDWINTVETIKDMRVCKIRRVPECANRKASETNGEMALYFFQGDTSKWPNRNAIGFHKAACLIWEMAGGAEEEDIECCPDDDEPVPMVFAKNIQYWHLSSDTLTDPNAQSVN